MSVNWEHAKEVFAHKNAEIEKLKAMNNELEGKLADIRQDSDDKESAYIAKVLAMNVELVEALIEIDDYLSTDIETTIGNDSAIHRNIQCKLSKVKELSHE